MADPHLSEDLRAVLLSVRDRMMLAARNWRADQTDAWLYGLFVGWQSSLGEVAYQHGWSEETRERLERFREIVVNAVESPSALDVDPQLGLRLTRIEAVLETLVQAGEAQTPVLQAILEAVVAPAGPSPTAELLRQIVASLDDVRGTLQELPETMAEVIRDALVGDAEPEGEESFETPPQIEHS